MKIVEKLITKKSRPGFLNITRQRKRIIVAIAVLVLLGSGLLLLNRISQISEEKIKILYKEAIDDPAKCSDGLRKLEGKEVDTDNKKESIATLEYRKYCQLSLMQYEEALETMEQLKLYYQEAGNDEALITLDEDIKGTQYNIENPVKKGPLQPTLGPEEQKAIKG